MSEWFSQLLAAKAEVVTAGFAGAFVAAIVEWNGILSAVRRVLVGVVCALFMHPLALPLVKTLFGIAQVPPEGAISVSGFIMGAVGIIFIEFLILTMRLRVKEKKDANS